MPSEFELIDRFLKPFARKGAGMLIGPGDDCAVLRARRGYDLCVTTDALVEGVHFDPALFTNEDVGYKALAINLSDLASMGAEPRWFFCSVACRPTDAPRLKGIARGMAQIGAHTRCVLAGGNFSRADVLSLHITAVGEVPQGRAITRAGGRPGDLIYVTGELGDSALALALRGLGRDPRRVLSRQIRPEPRLAVGAIARRFAHAAIDISDGLLQDLGHVLQASGIAAEIDAALVPTSRSFRAVSANLDLALGGGEDYELALLVPPERGAAFERACRAAREKVTLIGRAARGKGLRVQNAPHLAGGGFDHFAPRRPQSSVEFSQHAAKGVRRPRRRSAN